MFKNVLLSNYVLDKGFNWANLKPLLVNPNDSVAGVTLENEALLSAFFIVCVLYCLRRRNSTRIHDLW